MTTVYVLSDEQIASLPTSIQETLRRFTTEQEARESNLQAKYERLRVDSEQRYFELEQLQSLEHGKLESESKAASELRQLVADLEKKYNEISEKFRDLQMKFFEKDKYWNSQEQILLQKNSNLESERVDLIELLNKRNKEVDRLTDECRLTSDKLTEDIKLRLDAQTAADEAKSEMMILQHRDGRLNQEMNNMRQQNELLNEQLQERFNEIMAVRKEKSVRLIELQGLLDDNSAQVVHLEQNLEASKAIQAEQGIQIESYMEKLKQAQESHMHMEEQYHNELIAQEKLLNLYKMVSKESETKVQEMAKAVAELQDLLNHGTQAYSDLKSEQEELTKSFQGQTAERDERIHCLETELIHANELLEVMKKKAPTYISEEDAHAVSPLAAATSRLLKSGMTLTQIYSEYAEALGQLQQEKEENKRLTNYLDKILQEIEDKAPFIKQQKADFEEAVETIDRLTHQLDVSLLECEKCRQSADMSSSRCAELQRQNERYTLQLKDLSIQVRMLLKELEEARGTVVQMTTDEGRDDSSSEVTSSSLLISERLVTFRSIEELQEQNQKLLQVVRELSESSEANEKDRALSNEENLRISELTDQLKNAQTELEHMRDARERQAALVESLIQQRDMFKAIATTSQVPSSSLPARSPSSSTPGKFPTTPTTSASTVITALAEQDQKVLHETKTALKELQEEFSAYRTEKGKNEKMLNEQLEKVIQEASQLRLQSAKLASQLSFANERYKTLQSNIESHKKEIETLRERNQKFSDSVIKHQQTIALLREETKTLQEKLSIAEIRNQNLVKEKEMLKSLEARLSAELEAVRRDSQSRDLLLANLQTIQNKLERSDFETKTRLGQRIDALERENAILQKKAEGTDEQQKAFIITLERQLNEARTDADVERSKANRLSEQLNTADSHILHLKHELEETEAKLTANDTRINELSQLIKELQSQTDPSQKLREEIKTQKNQLDEAHSEIGNLKEKLEQSQKHVEQYKSIAEGLETNIKEQNEASRLYRESLEAQLNEAKQIKQMLEAELKDMEIDRLRVLEENTALKSENERISSEKLQLATDSGHMGSVSSERISSLEKELHEAIDGRNTALANEAAARSDCEVQAREAKEAHSKYERELVLHAADVETMSQIKQELESFNAKLAEAEIEAKEAKSLKLAAQESWMEQEALFQKELSSLRERLTSLYSQNSTLHQELEKISEQMALMQSQKEKEETQGHQLAEAVEKDANPRTTDQLLEVIRYLRREKEVTEAKHDMIEAEVNRLRHELAFLKKQLQSTEQSLAQEVEKSVIKVETAAEHAELMRKVETLNLLQDSNQLLRNEKERMFQQLKELETKNAHLEVEIEPLKDLSNCLTAERDSSRREVEVLKEEVDRWKSRTSHLIEQCSKFDPEELKRALDDRDQIKRQLETVSDECQSMKSEISRLNEQLMAAQSERAKANEQSQLLGNQLEEAKSAIAVKDADEEEKTKTIAQLRKIGRKYRMQAEEMQKELEELKAAGAQAASAEMNEKLKKAEQDLSVVQTKLKQAETEAGQTSARLNGLEQERNEALKQVKNADEKEKELEEQLTRLKQELSKASEERSSMADSHLKSVEERGKVMDEYNRLAEENKSLKEERDKLNELKSGVDEENRKMTEQIKELEKKQAMTRNLVMNAKQRLEERKAELEKMNAENKEMQRKIEEDKDEITRLTGEAEDLRQKLDQQASTEEMELRISTLKSQFEGKINRLEREVGEQTTAKTVEAETSERLRRENQELLQRVNVLQSQLEAFQRQMGQTPNKPTISAPPVERSGPGSADVSQRRTYIKPMTTAVPTMPQRHSAPVQPVRSTAGITAETRAVVASIRPMAVASTQPMTTPMATVMPTTMSLPENEGLPAPNILSQSTTTTAAAVMSQGRPTQQVQPVSSHVEESTVSSSEEPVGEVMQLVGSWWLEHATPSTSSEHTMLPSGTGTSSSSSSGLTNKRPREETRQQEESTENDSEAPAKRSKIQAGEAADTTETNAVTEVEREAASVAQTVDNQQPAAEMRRELEPVSTSLAMEELSRNSDLIQEDHARKHASVDQAEGLVNLPSDDLPDYQETEASAEYDIRPSTSRQHGSDVDEQSNQESINQSEPRDDAEEATTEMQPPDDVICVEEEEEEEEEGAESGVVCTGQTGGEEYQADNSEEEEEEYKYSEEVEEIEDDEFEGEDKEEGVNMDVYEGIDAEIQVEGEESTNDVIVVDDEAIAGPSGADGRHDRSTDDVILQDDNMVPMNAVSTSQPHQVMQRHTALSAVRLANTTASGDGGGPVRVIPQPSARSFGSQMDRLQLASRAQLMPFLFASEIGSGFEIGDDSIVPSTPTLQLSVRTDGFAEAVCSPQVTEEFTFGSSSESIPQLELAQQRGIGVDDTRMDLSQFDEHTSRGALSTPPCSQTSPAFHTSHLSPEPFQEQSQEVQNASSLSSRGDRPSSEATKISEPVPSCSSQTSGAMPSTGSRSQTPVPPEESSQEDTRGVTSEAGTESKPQGLDDRPSTSEGSAVDRPEAYAQTKPKIKKIVWQEPNRDELSSGVGGSTSGQQQISSLQHQQQLMPQQQGASTSQPRRGYARGGYRGRVAAAVQQQQQVRPLLAVPLVSPQAPQVARRARGNRGAGVWSTRQQHYQ